MRPLNPIVTATPPSGIRRFFDLANSVPDVISLGVGEPDFVTPWNIREAAIYSIERGHTTYTANAGLPELRRAIADDLLRRYGVAYHPGCEIIVTVGVSEGLDLALRTLLEPGDELIFVEPAYVSYVPCIRFAGGIPIAVPTSAEQRFVVDPARIERAVTPHTKAILLCSPGNPTGTVLPAEVLQRIVATAVHHDLYIISDEIYSRLVYNVEHTCVASLPGAYERTIVLNGLSKSHAMTGWRVAYVCAPQFIASEMLKIHQYTALCAPHVSQMAAIEALNAPQAHTDAMVAEYDRRRRFMVRELNGLGMPCHEPGGAFYVFPSVAPTGLTAEEYSERLLVEASVAVVPGDVFGPSGAGHVRCSYAAAFPLLEQAVERMRQFTRQRFAERRWATVEQMEEALALCA